MTSLATLRSELLRDPEVKAKYDRLGPTYAVVGEMITDRQQAECAADPGRDGAE